MTAGRIDSYILFLIIVFFLILRPAQQKQKKVDVEVRLKNQVLSVLLVSLLPTSLFMDFFALRYLHWSGFRSLTLTLLTAVSLSSS